MTGTEFVQMLVLNEVCDDYENVDQVILRAVSETGAKCGLTIYRSEVVSVLAALIQQAYSKPTISARTSHSVESSKECQRWIKLKSISGHTSMPQRKA